jgi:hypothetical protein
MPFFANISRDLCLLRPRIDNTGTRVLLRVRFKNQKRADFPGDLIGLVDRKAHEKEMSYGQWRWLSEAIFKRKLPLRR